MHEPGVLVMNSGFVIRKPQGHYCIQKNGSFSSASQLLGMGMERLAFKMVAFSLNILL